VRLVLVRRSAPQATVQAAAKHHTGYQRSIADHSITRQSAHQLLYYRNNVNVGIVDRRLFAIRVQATISYWWTNRL
jgi:hypothetical protein